jgi:hypothetical protein
MIGAAIYVLGYISPQCAKGGPCGSGGPIGEIALLAVLALGFVFGVLAWVQQRWNRGPVAWFLRWRGITRKAEDEPPNPFGR